MSLTPARHNFKIYEGATFYKRIYFEVDGVLQDLTDYYVELIIKDKPDGDTLYSLNSIDGGIDGGIKLGGVDGTIDITISASETESLGWTSGIYELFVTNTIPRTDVLLHGGFKVVPF